MDCEEAANLICARIDGELPVEDAAGVALEAHLAECAGCRATAEAMQLQDAALVRAFAPRRGVAEAVADRAVSRMLADGDAWAPRPLVVYVRPPRMRLWLTGAAASAVAAGIALAAVTLGPRLWRTESPKPVVKATQPATQPSMAQLFAQISLSTGEVFACPSHAKDAWQPVAAGAAVAEGDRVRTGPSARVELRLADGSQVRLNGGTEATFAAGRAVELKQGQVWSAVPADSQPLRVTMPPHAAGAPGGAPAGTVAAFTCPGGRTDLSCSAGVGVLTAVHGPAKVVDTRGAETQVPAGGSATILFGQATTQPAGGDVLLATRWLNELLVLKGREDPELTGRVNELLSRIKSESAALRPTTAPFGPGPVERDVRADGHLWSSPMACYVQSSDSKTDRAKRLTAARLLSDLAPPSAIPELIDLMGDPDGEVRLQVAKALQRLTGQTLGQTPEQCATCEGESVGQTQKKWQAWWEQNKGRYARP